MTTYLYKKEVSEEIRKEYGDDKGIVVYYNKHISNAVKLDNGGYVLIEKPSIITRFCYGYSDTFDGSEMQKAGKCAHNARTNTEYFIKQNLQPLEEKICDLYAGALAYKSYENAKIYELCFDDYAPKRYTDISFIELSKSEIERLINAYKEEIKKLTKRLNAYLQRYGLSKVYAWTYWRDE